MGNIIEKAMQFAAVKHDGQYRKESNIPYITHPLGVAMILQQTKVSEEVVAAGILHDTLEDTHTTEEELMEHFGRRVLQLVKAASEPDKSLPWEERKQHTIDSLPLMTSDEISVITADKLHNIRSIQADKNQIGESVWSRFNQEKSEQSWYYMSIVQALKPFKKEVSLVRLLEKEVFHLFVGKQTLTLKEIDELFGCAYHQYNEEQKHALESIGILDFVKEMVECAENTYRNNDFDKISPLMESLRERGIEFEMNSDGPFILLSYSAELKHRLAWSDETLYKHFKRNLKKL